MNHKLNLGDTAEVSAEAAGVPVSDKVKVKVLSALFKNGKEILAGEVVELTPATAENFVKNGDAEYVKE